MGGLLLSQAHGQSSSIAPPMTTRAPWTSLGAGVGRMGDGVSGEGARQSPGHEAQLSPPYGVRYTDPQLAQVASDTNPHQHPEVGFQHGLATANGQFPFQSQDSSRSYMGYGNL